MGLRRAAIACCRNPEDNNRPIRINAKRQLAVCWDRAAYTSLDGEVSALYRCVGKLRGEDVLLAQDRRLPIDHQSGALVHI
jgi:hypothetical protein